jgi:hypothetical protein
VKRRTRRLRGNVHLPADSAGTSCHAAMTLRIATIWRIEQARHRRRPSPPVRVAAAFTSRTGGSHDLQGVSPLCRHGLRGSGASPESEVCGRDHGFIGQMPSLAFTTARLARVEPRRCRGSGRARRPEKLSSEIADRYGVQPGHGRPGHPAEGFWLPGGVQGSHPPGWNECFARQPTTSPARSRSGPARDHSPGHLPYLSRVLDERTAMRNRRIFGHGTR